MGNMLVPGLVVVVVVAMQWLWCVDVHCTSLSDVMGRLGTVMHSLYSTLFDPSLCVQIVRTSRFRIRIKRKLLHGYMVIDLSSVGQFN